jgi:low affinity Fe/Cu permease
VAGGTWLAVFCGVNLRRHLSDGERTDASLPEFFRRFACWASEHMGTHWAFLVALGLVIVWGLTGPLFDYSSGWQLVINTGTTIVTFLMVFLLQTTQNRDAKAIQLKLDELIRSSKARNLFADLEHATEAEILLLKDEFRRLRERSRDAIEVRRGEVDVHLHRADARLRALEKTGDRRRTARHPGEQ